MISDGYERVLFESPASECFAIARDVHIQANAEADSAMVVVLTVEHDQVKWLRRAARTVKAVVESDEVLFQVVERRHPRGALALEATDIGKRLMSLWEVSREELKLHFPQHGFNPFVEVLFEARQLGPSDLVYGRDWQRFRNDEATQVCALANTFVGRLRALGRNTKVMTVLDRSRRSLDKNAKSVREYVDAIFERKGSRHLVIRLDLGYAVEQIAVSRPTSVTIEQVRRDLTRFQRYVREKLPMTGFVAKLEYGLLRGYHVHFLLFLNGHVVREDVVIAKRLGQYWERVICEGHGRYWNCNARAYYHRGVGMIDWTDGDKRAALLNHVVPYLVKTDFWLCFKPDGKTLFRGLMPKRPPAVGRPRGS